MDFPIEALRNAVSGLHKMLRRDLVERTAFSLTEMQTISLLYKNAQMLPSELAQKTRVTTPSMSQILKKLDGQQLILRSPSPHDGRKVMISLTPEGRDIVEQARHNKDEILRHLITSRLTDTEIQLLERAVPLLQKLNA